MDTTVHRSVSPPLYKPPTPVTSSDLISSSSTPVMSSPYMSPVPSPSLAQRNWAPLGPGGELLPPLPQSSERTIKIKKGNDQLGKPEKI